MHQGESVSDLLASLRTLVRDAGDAILRLGASGDAIASRAKADSSPLTAADLAANAVLVAGLAALTPDIDVVSEEGAAPDEAGATRWLVDPLDGTREFIRRNGEFTVNVALVVGDTPRLGVVHAPALDVTWWGGSGLGAFRTRGRDDRAAHAIRVAPLPAADAPVRIVASRSHLDAETLRFIAGFARYELLCAGSSLKLCRVAEGAADLYPRLAPTSAWDTAAAHAVLEGAGGHLLRLDGAPLRYPRATLLNPPFVAVSDPRLLARGMAVK